MTLPEWAVEGPLSSSLKSSTSRLAVERKARVALAAKVIPFGVSYLDDCLGGIHPTDLIVISAASGAGKTTLGTLLAMSAASKHRRVAFFALEAYENEIEQRLLFARMCQIDARHGRRYDITFASWMMGQCGDVGWLEAKAADELDLSGLRTLYRKESFGADDITAQFLAIRSKVDLIILDHLHYVDYDGLSENAGLRKVVRAIRTAALEIQTPVIVIAHLRKRDAKTAGLIPTVDDIHGSSDIAKVATKIVVLAPMRGTQFAASPPYISNTVMQVIKDRYAGTNGFAAMMEYDLRSQSYLDRYVVYKPTWGNKDLDKVDPDKVPRWAKRAARTT